MTTPTPSARSGVGGAAWVAVAMAIMNVTTYGFNIVAVYLIVPGEYGVTAAMMGLVNVANVMALGLQAAGARHMAVAADRPTVEAALLRLSWQSGLAVAALCLLAAPLIELGLGVGDLLTASMLGLAMLPLTILGGQAGALQGTSRWRELGAVYVTLGVTRLAAAGILWWWPTGLASLVAVAAAAWAPVAVGAVALRRDDTAGRERRRRVVANEKAILGEILHNSHALLALFSLSVVDVLVAKALLDDHTAGVYAAGSILTKTVLFLPQFVVVLAFPAMARTDRSARLHLKALAVVAALGGASVLGCLLLPGLALLVTGGSDFVEVQPLLAGFALLGTILAMLQVLVYDAIARRLGGCVPLLWLGLAVVLVLTRGADSMTSLLSTVTAIDAGLLVVLLLLGEAITRRRARAAQPVGASEASPVAGG